MLERKFQKHKIENYIVFCFMIPIMNGYISELLKTVNSNVNFSIFVYIVMYIFSIYIYLITLINYPFKFVLTFSFILMAFILSFLFNSDTIKYAFNITNNSLAELAKSNFIIFFGLNLPIFLLFFYHIDYEYLFNIFSKFGFITLILFIVVNILENFIFHTFTNYMTIAYDSIISICIVFSYGIKKHKIFYIMLSIFATGFIILGGSRGAALTIIVFFSLYFLFYRKLSIKKIIFSLIMLLIILVGLNYISELTEFLSKKLNEHGYSSRLINILLGQEGGLNHYGDRYVIQKILLNSINIFGYGIYGDKVLTLGSYAHNFFLEITIQYGLIISLCFTIFLIHLIVHIVKIAKINYYIKIWTLIFFSIFFIKYMFSASYLLNMDFWLLFGILCNINQYKKTNIIDENLLQKLNR